MQHPIEVDQRPLDDIALIDRHFVKRTRDLFTRSRINAIGQSRRLGNKLRELTTDCLDAVNSVVTKLRNRLLSVIVPAKPHLRLTQSRLASLHENVFGKGLKLGKVLRELPAHSVQVVTGELTKAGELLGKALEPAKANLGRTRDMFTKLTRNSDHKSRELRTREKDLRNLLANSVDAVIVTSSDRRFVAANAKGLSLFGISETNMKMFTIDVFLSGGQIPHFVETGASFINRKKPHGECEIRRLDGSLRVAEFVFVPNYVPFSHVFRFQNERKRTSGKRLAA